MVWKEEQKPPQWHTHLQDTVEGDIVWVDARHHTPPYPHSADHHVSLPQPAVGQPGHLLLPVPPRQVGGGQAGLAGLLGDHRVCPRATTADGGEVRLGHSVLAQGQHDRGHNRISRDGVRWPAVSGRLSCVYSGRIRHNTTRRHLENMVHSQSPNDGILKKTCCNIPF